MEEDLDKEILSEAWRISQLEFQLALLKSSRKSDALNESVSQELKRRGVKDPGERFRDFKAQVQRQLQEENKIDAAQEMQVKNYLDSLFEI